MGKYILKRLGMMIFVVLGISFIIFSFLELTPGDAAEIMAGQNATPEKVAQLREEFGLNKPFYARYFNFIFGAVQGNFGLSYRSRLPVFTEILEQFPSTLLLAFMAMTVATIIGLPVGVISAVKQYSFLDRTSMIFAMLFAAIPSFLLGLVLQLIFAVKLRLLPPMGVNNWYNYILPAMTLSTFTLATLIRMTRSTMLEAIRQDYVRTARAKGVAESRIVMKHVLRNAMLPIITVIGADFGYLLGGAVIVESVFAMPGIGSLLITSVRAKDTPMVLAIVMFITLSYSIVNLLVDLSYSVIDPRVRTQYAKR